MNNFLFIGLPYLSLALFFVGSIYRYKQKGYHVSSLSSQFLEGRKLFYGAIPFHWGIVVVFFGHLLAFTFPETVLAWNSQPVRLLILEISAFVFGISMLFGLINLIYRRITTPRLKPVTNYMDWIIYTLLIVQTIFGLWVAFEYRWGSSWFSSMLTSYLYSIFMFNPDTSAIVLLPWVIKTHIVTAYLIIALIPFSRLIHFLVYPLPYLWRPFQQVRWNWDRKKIRSTKTQWTMFRPKNN